MRPFIYGLAYTSVSGHHGLLHTGMPFPFFTHYFSFHLTSITFPAVILLATKNVALCLPKRAE